jgi:hypothetical protein
MTFQKQIDLMNRACIRKFADDVISFFFDDESLNYSINGIFDNEFVIVDPDTQASVVSTRPVVQIQKRDLSHLPEGGDPVSVNETSYEVYEVHPDNKGLLTIFLHEVVGA